MGMTFYRINGKVICLDHTHKELAELVGKAAALIKTVCGIGNNAAWAAVLEAHDEVKKHPSYRHRVKQTFREALDEFNVYERRLLYATENRMFHVEDLTPEYRKRYGDITDREYYDFWAGTGGTAYMKTKVWVNNLRNKFKISLESHKVKNAEIVAWAMVADACLRLAQCMYIRSIDVCTQEFGVPKDLLNAIFGQFNVKVIADKWDKALMLLEPYTKGLDTSEQKNIQFGLDDLLDQWSSIATVTGSLTETIEAYEEVFRTKGEMKKALRHIAEVRQ